MKIANELKKNQIILINTSNSYIQEIRQFYKKYKIGLITTNKTVENTITKLEQNKIKTENILFIDAYTLTKKAPLIIKNCVFISSPGALTELKVAFFSFIGEKNCDLMIFDSITDLLEYNELDEIFKFFNSLIIEIKITGKKVIFLNKKNDKNFLLNDIEMFCDKIIDL